MPPARTVLSVIQICRDDIERLCGNDNSGPAANQCLQDHFTEVSHRCHEMLQAMRDNFAPCKDEIAQYCVNVGYGGGRMMKCLGENRARLSEACLKIISHNKP